MTPSRDQRSISDLFGQALEQISHLMRTELDLARTEVMVKLSRALVGVAMMGAAALFVIPALVLLLMAVAATLVHFGLPPGWSDLIAACLGFAVAGALGWTGLSRLKAENLLPDRTMGQFRRDVNAVKEQTR